MPTTMRVKGFECDLSGLGNDAEGEQSLVELLECAQEGDADSGWFERQLAPEFARRSPPVRLSVALEDEDGQPFLLEVAEGKARHEAASAGSAAMRFTRLCGREVLTRPRQADPFTSGPPKRRIAAVERALTHCVERLPPAVASQKAVAALEHPSNRSEHEVRRVLFRAVTMRRHPEVFERLMKGLREEEDLVAEVIASLIWRQGPLVDGIPALLEQARARSDDARFVGRLAGIVAQMKK